VTEDDAWSLSMFIRFRSVRRRIGAGTCRLLLAESSLQTWCIVGRDMGFSCTHNNARAVAKTSSWTIGPTGGVSLSSKRFEKGISCPPDCKCKSISPGCFPITTSSATTPKLYTSSFSVTWPVEASSAKHRGIVVSRHGNIVQMVSCFRRRNTRRCC